MQPQQPVAAVSNRPQHHVDLEGEPSRRRFEIFKLRIQQVAAHQ